MPIVERPRGFDQIVGLGVEKLVSGQSNTLNDNKPKVIKDTFVYFEDFEKSPNFVKAQFYLTKLVHLLFPENVPDIYFASIKESNKVTVDQRIEVVDGERTKNKIKADPAMAKRIDLVGN